MNNYRACILLFIVVLGGTEGQLDNQLGFDWKKLLSQFGNGMMGVNNTNDALLKFLNIPFVNNALNFSGVNPVLLKAFVTSVSPNILFQDVNLVRVLRGITNGSINVQNPTKLALLIVDNINLNNLTEYVDFDKFFNTADVNKSLIDSGINPAFMRSFIRHVDIHKFVKAVKLKQILELYIVRNNISTEEKTKRILNNTDTDMLIEAVDWDGALEDEVVLSFLNASGVNALTIGFARTIGVKKLLKSLDMKRVVSDALSRSFDADEIFKYIEFKDLHETLDFDKLFETKGVNKSLEKAGINPKIMKAFVQYIDDKEKFEKAINLTEIIKLYGDNNEEKEQQILNLIDTDLLIDSVNWDGVLTDKQILNISGITPFMGEMLRNIGMKQLLKSLDSKQLLQDVISGSFNTNGMNSLMKYVDMNKMKRNIKFQMILRAVIGAKTSVALSQMCSDTFLDMMFPLPDFSNFDDSNEMILKVQHPLLQLFDSWSKIPPRMLLFKRDWLGASDQCSNIPNAHYCLYDYKLVEGGVFGYCMPKACTLHDGKILVEYISENLFQGLVQKNEWGWIRTKTGYHTTCKSKQPHSTGFKGTTRICIALLSLIIFATCLDGFDRYMIKLSKYKKMNGNNTEEPKSKNKKASIPMFAKKMIICFSALKNTEAVVSTFTPPSAITCINSIRTVSMLWVILGHYFSMMPWMQTDNVATILDLRYERMSLVILNAFPCVDTFFILSGLLLSYLSLKRMDKSEGKLTLLMFYTHRFLRVTPVYLFTILLVTNITPYIVPGSMGFLESIDERCPRFWWTNMLFINNFYPKHFYSQCMVHTWYLAVDMQFYLVAPAFLYMIYHLEKYLVRKKKSKIWSGPVVLGGGILACVLTNVTIIAYNDYPLLHSAHIIEGNPRKRQSAKVQDEVYDKPYTRIMSYLVGMLVGYLFSRKVELKNFIVNKNLRSLFNVTMWTISFVMAYYIIYGPWKMYVKENPVFLTDAENIAFGSLHMLGWSLAVGWVIYACHSGMGGYINDFLSWKAWLPLSRLTFGAYLLHPTVAMYFMKAFGDGYSYQTTAFAFHFISVTVMTFVASFILAIGVEFPVMHLEKLLFM